ncbi:VOC family protein [Thermodesulfobacteriota bacterium]
MAEEDNKKSPFSKLAQIGIIVKDMDETIKKLESFGIGPFEHRSVPSGAKEWYKGKPMEATFKITAVNVGGVELEFIQPVDGESPHRAFLDEKGEGIQHLAFAVEDLEKNIEDLKEKGASVQMQSDLGMLKVAYMDLETSGLVFELMQFKPEF